MSADLSNEELYDMYLECGKDILKYGRLVIAHTERRNMFPGIVPNIHSDQFSPVCLVENP